MNKLIYVAAAAAFTLSLNVPTGAVAAPLDNLGYKTGGATIEHVRSRGGRNWNGGRHWHGGGRWNGGWGGGWGWPGFGWSLGAGILGFGLGAAIANDRYYDDYYDDYDYQYADDHVARCAARYRSYDPASDTFLGYDGYRHYCNL